MFYHVTTNQRLFEQYATTQQHLYETVSTMQLQLCQHKTLPVLKLSNPSINYINSDGRSHR